MIRARLTPKERGDALKPDTEVRLIQAFNRYCRGESFKQIAPDFNITENTLDTGIALLRAKYYAVNNAHLVLILHEKGLISLKL